jgi:flagellar biogenesis protein FliO
VKIVLTLAIVIILISLLAMVMKRFSGGHFIIGHRNRQPRLQVLEAIAVDTRRKLVLVRRDEVEHLLMIGGADDILVEQCIYKGVSAAMRRPGPPPGAKKPLPSAPPAQTQEQNSLSQKPQLPLPRDTNGNALKSGEIKDTKNLSPYAPRSMEARSEKLSAPQAATAAGASLPWMRNNAEAKTPSPFEKPRQEPEKSAPFTSDKVTPFSKFERKPFAEKYKNEEDETASIKKIESQLEESLRSALEAETDLDVHKPSEAKSAVSATGERKPQSFSSFIKKSTAEKMNAERQDASKQVEPHSPATPPQPTHQEKTAETAQQAKDTTQKPAPSDEIKKDVASTPQQPKPTPASAETPPSNVEKPQAKNEPAQQEDKQPSKIMPGFEPKPTRLEAIPVRVPTRGPAAGVKTAPVTKTEENAEAKDTPQTEAEQASSQKEAPASQQPTDNLNPSPSSEKIEEKQPEQEKEPTAQTPNTGEEKPKAEQQQETAEKNSEAKSDDEDTGELENEMQRLLTEIAGAKAQS